MSAFFCTKSAFFGKQYLYSKQLYESCVKDFLVLFSGFVREKVTNNENVSCIDQASRIRLLDCCKLTIGKKTMKSQLNDMTSSSIFLTLPCCSCSFSYWSKFHVNIMIVSGVMTNFVNKRID